MLPFASPSIKKAEIAAVERVLRSGWLSSGPETTQFEHEFASYINDHPAEKQRKRKLHALCVSSCSVGLELAVRVLDLPPKVPLLLSPYTFVSTASAVLHAGLPLAFIDIDTDSMLPSPQNLRNTLRKRKYSAILFPHISGIVNEHYTELLYIARQHGLKIIEDAAHSFPAKGRDGYLGTYGDIGVYSFYANKTITSGEGGMMVSRSKRIMQRLERLRNHGFDKNAWNRHRNNAKENYYDIIELGYKYNMSDIHAALGRVQLQRASSMQKKRIALAKEYRKILSTRDCWILPTYPHEDLSHSWSLYMILIKHPKHSRNYFLEKLAHHGISTSLHYKPLHMMSYYKKTYSFSPTDFPNSLERYTSTLSLPLYPDLDIKTIRWIGKTLIHIADT